MAWLPADFVHPAWVAVGEGYHLRPIAAVWRHGSVVRSWLCELAERAFEHRAARLADPRQCAPHDHGQHLSGLADREQGAEGGVTGLGQVGERGPSQGLAFRAHRWTPSHRPSAVQATPPSKNRMAR